MQVIKKTITHSQFLTGIPKSNISILWSELALCPSRKSRVAILSFARM